MNYLVAIWWIATLLSMVFTVRFKEVWCLVGMVAMMFIGVSYITTIHKKIARHREVSSLMEEFIRSNSLMQSYLDENGKEIVTFYPVIEYRECIEENALYLRFRLDGSCIGRKLRGIEQALADKFATICNEIIEERGYITYVLEIEPEEQKIVSSKDDYEIRDGEIIFSKGISWRYIQEPHMLLIGNTGSGKTKLLLYVIDCLLRQSARVIFCDGKLDIDIKNYICNEPMPYLSDASEIVNAVRETVNELRSRQRALEPVGITEAEFRPIFLVVDELMALSKRMNKQTYQEMLTGLSEIVSIGRSYRMFAIISMQRCDTTYIEGAIRDNLCCRICMGHMSENAYKMAFGSDFAKVKNTRYEIGSGLIFRQGVDTKPKEFIAPFICKGALSGTD